MDLQNIVRCFVCFCIFLCNGFEIPNQHASRSTGCGFHATFDATPGYALYGQENEILDNTTEPECARRCMVKGDACLSFNYNNCTETCHLSAESRDTVLTYGRNRHMTYYHKICTESGTDDGDNDGDDDDAYPDMSGSGNGSDDDDAYPDMSGSGNGSDDDDDAYPDMSGSGNGSDDDDDWYPDMSGSGNGDDESEESGFVSTTKSTTGDYSVHYDSDCWGNDFLGGFDGISQVECKEICDESPECVAFAYLATKVTTCWPKNKCEEIVPNTQGWTIYRKIQDESEGGGSVNTTESTNGGCLFRSEPGHALYGHNDKVLNDVSVETCMSACEEDSACLSFDFSMTTGSCFISYSSKLTDPNAYDNHATMTYYHKECNVTRPTDEDNQGETDGEEESGSGSTQTDDEDDTTGGPPCLQVNEPVGGNGGFAFSDEEIFRKHYGVISQIHLYSGNFINCLGFTYGRGEEAEVGPCHGHKDDIKTLIDLELDEYITRFEARVGGLFDQLTIVTNKREYGYYGGHGGQRVTLESDGRRLAYISGRSGHHVDQLTMYFYC